MLIFGKFVYVMRKEMFPDKIGDIFKTLPLNFHFENLRSSDLVVVANLRCSDFEDAIAHRLSADYVITRNIKDYLESKVPTYTPSEFLARW